MAVFRIPVKWSHWGIYEIEAENKHEAMHFAKFLPLPALEEFIPESFEVLEDKIEEIM